MKHTKQARGAAAFDAYYGELFDSRWPDLRTALLKETQPVAFSVCGGKPYYLDAASICAAQALPPLDAGQCLDMCAAPGGKTLVLASRMGAEVHIQANELSRTRRARLLKVAEEHLPAEMRSRISITGFDAATLPRSQQAFYDRILLDAPCSSERHVITDPKYLADWTSARIKMLSQRQWALLSAAFLLLKPGGFLLYATCALANAENDGVVRKLLKKYGDAAVITTPFDHANGASISNPIHTNAHEEQDEPRPFPVYETTQYGCRFLPDTGNGAGPLYFSLIEKKY